jgi:DNA repair photolyase
MPMTFDQFSECSYRCLYCFAYNRKGIGAGKERFYANNVASVNVEGVKRLFTSPGQSQFADFIKERKVMQWGGMADPFDEHERETGVGLELLRFFRSIDYPLCFSTKATWWTEDERYVSLFKQATNWNVKVSIITLDEDKAHRVEVGVPTPQERLEAMARIARFNQGGVTLRLRPFMMGISDPSHTDLIRLAGEAGAGAVSTEFFCLERRSPMLKRFIPVINQVAGFDVVAYYRKFSTGSGYLRLSRNIKRPYVDQMEQAARSVGMRFYVSDAHFKERCDNGSCCGLTPDWNYARGQFCEALMIAKERGYVTWDDLDSHLAYADKFLWRVADGYNNGSLEARAERWWGTMKDFIRERWNSPNSGESPYRMFEGVLRPDRVDEKGNVVYVYDASRA